MKKVLIEIPDEFENDLKDKFNDFFGRVKADLKDSSETLLCGNYEMETIDMFLKSFDSVKVISEMTNGDVIKLLFPDAKTWEVARDDIHCAYIEFKNICEIKSFPLSWWNAPYKVESEE